MRQSVMHLVKDLYKYRSYFYLRPRHASETQLVNMRKIVSISANFNWNLYIKKLNHLEDILTSCALIFTNMMIRDIRSH